MTTATAFVICMILSLLLKITSNAGLYVLFGVPYFVCYIVVIYGVWEWMSRVMI